MVVDHHEDLRQHAVEGLGANEEVDITSLTLATDALEYSRGLVEIFSRSVDGQYGRLEDYSMHRNRCSRDPVPENWMSTPMVPLYISSIFGRAIEGASDLQRPLVRKIGQYICDDFEKLGRMAEEIGLRSPSALSIAAGNARHLLSHIRKSIE